MDEGAKAEFRIARRLGLVNESRILWAFFLSRDPPSAHGDDRPHGFDKPEWPRALQKSIHGCQDARARERQYEPTAAMFERVTQQHCCDRK
jgi:hypothetical protein